MARHPQLTRAGELRHLLTTEGLSRAVVTHILDTAVQFVSDPESDSNGAANQAPLLQGKSLTHLFLAPSPHTRTAFEIAGSRLGANILDIDHQGLVTDKRVSLADIVEKLALLHADIVVIRHPQSGAPFLMASVAAHCAPNMHIINAGDGFHADPTQALADMYTIRHHKHDFTRLTVALVGDVLHSRIARSDIHALTTLGAPEVRVIGPQTLLPTGLEQMGVRVLHDIDAGLRGADVIIVLRMREEHLNSPLFPSAREYARSWGLTAERLALANPDAIVLHPGIVGHGVEIDFAVADGPQLVTSNQENVGIAVRMAVMSIVAGSKQ